MKKFTYFRRALCSAIALGAMFVTASLAQATLVQRMPEGFFAAVPKSWGQCAWQGGLGLTQACKFEDCPEDGGWADCTEPKIVPPNGRPASDADANGFIYGMCDEAGPYTYRDRRWCESAGGTWGGPTDCHGLPPVVVGGGGTMVKDEAASEVIALEFETRTIGGCGISASPTPWAANTTGSQHCWNGPRVERNGKILSDMRYTTYESPHSGFGCAQGPVQELVYFQRARELACPEGYTRRDAFDGDLQCVRPMSQYCPTVGDSTGDSTVGNPIAPITGAKLQSENDYRAGGIGGLEFTRYYNSQGYFRTRGEGNERSVMGENWRHTYQRSLHFYADQTYAIGGAKRPNGVVIFFDAAGKELHNRDGAAARLVKIDPPVSGVSWKLTLADDSTESYDASGKLLSIRTRSGRVTTMGWTSGQLTSVTDPFGRGLSLSYGANGRIQTLTQPDAQTVGYVYDESGRLIFATYPGSTAREYHYELTSPYANLLTGITDENEVRYATFTYSGGYATGTQHAGGVDNYQLVYNGASTTVTDPLGTVRSYAYALQNGVRKLTGLSQPCASCGGGNAQTTTYDTNGNVASRTDFNGNRTNYTFDATRNLETSRTEGLTSTGATTAVTRTIATTWHPTFRLPATLTEPDGNGGTRVTTFTYDGGGNLTNETIAAGSLSRNWGYTYDSYGRLLTEDGPRTDVSDVITYTYYANNDPCVTCRGQLHTVANALGHVTTYTQYDANGRVTRVIDPNNVVTATSYHVRGWPTQRTTAYGTSAAETITTTYDDAGLVIRVMQPDGSYIDFDHDDAHRVIGETDALGNSTLRTLDSNGNETMYAALDPQGMKRTARSRVFDSLGRISKDIDAYGETTQYGYDANSNQIAVIDPAGGLTTTSYDALNRARATVDAAGGSVVTGYDAANQIRTVTDPNGLVTTYGYDGLGNATSVTSPDTGTTQKTFDAAGNKLTEVDARNVTTGIVYDVLNRPLERTSGSGGNAVTIDYTYDLNTHGKGRLSGVSGAGSTIELTYDAVGRTTSRAETIDATALTIQYTYDNGRLVAMTYPSGAVVAYGHDATGRTTTVSINGAALAEGLRYVPFGALDGFEFAHGPGVQRVFDLNGRAVRLTLGPQSATTTTTSYEYDTLSRLTRAQVSGSRDFRYTYDATGNRTSTSLNSTTTTYGYVANTHRLDATAGANAHSYEYDAVGNAVERGGDTSTYDARGRLVAYSGETSASYVINSFGQRVEKQAGDTVRFAYDIDGTLLGEYSSDMSGKEYVYVDRLPIGVIAKLENGKGRHAIYADHLGTPRVMEHIDSGFLPWQWQIDGATFGEDSPTLDSTPPSGSEIALTSNLRFPGQYYDGESGLHYNYYRNYDPLIGRYAESDPIGLEGGVGTYTYVLNNALGFIDPNGLVSMCRLAATTAGAVVGGSLGYVCGCGLGGIIGGGGGTLVAPGIGTVGGAAAGCAGGGQVGGGLGAAAGAWAGNTAADSMCQDDEPSCSEHRTRCFGTSLADGVGGGYGAGRCSLCYDKCMQDDGLWPLRARTGDRCDYWNFQ
jgi:RHS repeat-associated protein